MTMSKTALAYQRAGLSVIPTGTNKRPRLPSWAEYQKSSASPEAIQEWFQDGKAQLAVICGQVSGGLEILDFDGQGEQFQSWAELIKQENSDLYSRLIIEKSPSGGFHCAYRCSDFKIPGNSKLSQKGIEVSSQGEYPYKGKILKAVKHGDKWFIIAELIETRGEGGYCLVAPSEGYTPIQGSLCNLPTVTAAERALLIDTARFLNQWITPGDFQRTYTKPSSAPGQKLPGDDFDERGDLAELLLKHGWTRTGRTGTVNGSPAEYWRRPGKSQGQSATLIAGKTLYVFSSNAHPFEPGKGYGPFGVYTILEHNGDFSTASRALARQGYGQAKEQVRVSGACFNQLSARFSQKTEWVYRKLIPKGQPSLFNGREGDGKSTICLQSAKETLETYPNGIIIWIASEGTIRNTFTQMADIGLTSERFLIAQKSDGSFLFDFGQKADLIAFEVFLASFDSPILSIYLDSLRGISAVPENESQIGRIMYRLNSLVCDRFGSALIYLHHLNKSGQGSLLNQSSGSTAITAAVRHVLTVTRRSKFVRVIRCAKSNIDDMIPVLESIKVKDGIRIQEAVRPTEENFTDKAEAFLTELFADRPEIKATEIYAEGEKLGFSSSLLKKVKNILGIEVKKKGFNDAWMWIWNILPENRVPSENEEKTVDVSSCNCAKGAKGHYNHNTGMEQPEETLEKHPNAEGTRRDTRATEKKEVSLRYSSSVHASERDFFKRDPRASEEESEREPGDEDEPIEILEVVADDLRSHDLFDR